MKVSVEKMAKKAERQILTTLFAYVAFIIFVAVGWIANIYQIVQSNEITTMVIVKFIGIFIAPLGFVLGYIGFF